ncbi:hypothetical protein [Prosthecobacter sp.]|jgi:hypothetical protein|uniref:hypothetical protein n=1 Tax=Prosthecobacter sp. TaxID=1965333 RepID=UPI0037833B85
MKAICLSFVLTAALATSAAPVAVSPSLIESPQTGGLELKSLSSLSFGPGGLLLVAEPGSASVVAIQTGDVGPEKKVLDKPVTDISSVIAGGLGVKKEDITIKDLAVNPASGRIYLAVQRRPDNAVLIVTVDAAGKVAPFDTAKLPWARITLPGGTASKVTNITDVAFDGTRVFATGTCNEEFASRIFTIPVPIKHGSTANVFSAETYHVAHRKWETKAPIQSFVPYSNNGETYVVGAFACTPVAKFKVDDIQSGAQVKGVSMVELGSGNRPLDLFSYTDKSGKDWLVVHTQRFKQNAFGPSKMWGARISMDYLDAKAPDKTNENAARRDEKAPKGPDGIEIVDSLFGAVQADKFDNTKAIILKDNEGTLSLEVAVLP